MTFDYSAAKFWLDAAQLLGTIAIGIYLWVVGRTRYNAEQHRAHEVAVDRRLDGNEERITRVEEIVKSLPDSSAQSAALSRVHKRIDEVTRKTSRMEGELSGVKSSLGRVNDHLLREK